MSGIAGAADRNGAESSPPLPEILRGLLAAMAHRGGVALPSSGRPSVVLREAIGHGQGQGWADAHCALGAQLLPRTPEDSLEQQPLRDPASGCVLVWDGRLDNREELAAALEDSAQSLPDSALVLRAFLRWREGCAAKLLGDFAFAVWHPKERALYAARDPMGVRPLFYHASGDRFALASEVQALFTVPGVTRTPDDVMAGEALLWWTAFAEIERTFYRDVNRLPPAHWLRWTVNGLRIERYWDIDPGRQLRYPQREQYIEQYADVLRQAVSCRLRSARPIGIFLSGGMDSSAVASVTGQLAPAAGARTFHLQLTGDENDESRIAGEVAQNAGLPFLSNPLRARMVLDELEPFLRLTGVPQADLFFPNDLSLMRMAAAEGCGPLFTGDGSDEVFAYAWGYVADLVRSLRCVRLARTLKPYSAYHGHPTGYFLKKSVRYFVPRPLHAAWRRLRWREVPAWIAPDFARRIGLTDRLCRLPAPTRFSSFSTQDDYVALTRGRRVLMDESRELLAARLGLEYRFPFYDSRMLEFMFAVPWELKVDGWKVKPFLREAPGLLPEELRHATRKANYNSFADRQWEAQDWKWLAEIFNSPPQRALEYVNLPAARSLQQSASAGARSSRQISLAILNFFLWLRTEFPVHSG